MTDYDFFWGGGARLSRNVYRLTSLYRFMCSCIFLIALAPSCHKMAEDTVYLKSQLFRLLPATKPKQLA